MLIYIAAQLLRLAFSIFVLMLIPPSYVWLQSILILTASEFFDFYPLHWTLGPQLNLQRYHVGDKIMDQFLLFLVLVYLSCWWYSPRGSLSWMRVFYLVTWSVWLFRWVGIALFVSYNDRRWLSLFPNFVAGFVILYSISLSFPLALWGVIVLLSVYIPLKVRLERKMHGME